MLEMEWNSSIENMKCLSFWEDGLHCILDGQAEDVVLRLHKT